MNGPLKRWLGAISACSLIWLAHPRDAAGAVTYIGSTDPNSITLQELVDGGSIVVNDLTFSNWTISLNVLISDHPTLEAVDPSNVMVVGLDDDPFNEGVGYSSGTFGTKGSSVYHVEDFAMLPDPHSIDAMFFEWRYEVTSVVGSTIKDNSLDISAPGDFSVDNQFGNDPKGVLEIGENPSSGTTLLGFKGVAVDRISDSEELFDEIVFANQSSILVDSSINLTTGVNGDRVEL